jgi:hypothetical protein
VTASRPVPRIAPTSRPEPGPDDAADADFLETLALRSLEWTRARTSSFRLPERITEPDIDVNRSVKPLGELAQLSVSIRRETAPEHAVHRIAGELLAFCWRETAEGAVLLDLFRAEPQATYPVEIYAAFAAAGLRHAGFEHFAGTVCRTRGWRVTEQEPNRRLSILNAERRGGVTPHRRFDSVLRRTWLGGLPEPWMFERTTGYQLTHAVFHTTDWGSTPRLLPPELADYLHTWLPCWLDTCLDAGQWDLSCELLAVAASLPEPLPARHTRPAWARIAAARGADGALPETGPALPPGDPRHFLLSYHSTLAAAFAAVLTAARLRSGHRKARP